MKKVSLLPLLIVLFSLVLPQITLAGSFVFTEEFDSTSKIFSSFSRVDIREGKLFTANDATSSRVESKLVKKTSYDITKAVLNATFSVPVTGGEIVFYLSNNDGETWEWARPGLIHDFKSQGRELAWAAEITRPSTSHQSPFIESLAINFSEGGDKLKDKGDSKRISELRKVSSALNAYFKKHGDYPYVNGGDGRVRWTELGSALTKKDGKNKSAIKTMPEPVLSINNEKIYYDYARFTDLNGQKGFILAVVLENPNNKNLKKDYDGALSYINCNDPVYCLVGGIPKKSKSSNKAVLGIEDVQIIPGSLVKLQIKNEVYYITDKGMKRYVPNEAVFLSYGNRWTDIIILPGSAESKFYATPENRFIFLETQKPRSIYYISHGKKYFLSDTYLSQLNLHESEIAPVNSTEFKAYPLDVLTQKISEEIKRTAL